MVGVQNPVRLSDLSEPQPDFSVLKARPDGYAARHPRPDDILLIIEVADSSLPVDTKVKAPLYAVSGVRELWIVDLDGSRIEVYRDPSPEGYRKQEHVGRGETLRVDAMPDVAIAVDEIVI